MYSLSSDAVFLQLPSTFLTLPWQTTPLQASSLLPHLQCRPVQPPRDNSRQQACRHTKSNTSNVLSSSLMLTEGDSCHSPFPGKAKEGFGHHNLLDPTAEPGYYSRMSQLPWNTTRRGDVECWIQTHSTPKPVQFAAPSPWKLSGYLSTNRWRVHTGTCRYKTSAHSNLTKVIFFLVDVLQTSKLKHPNERAIKKTIHRFNSNKQKDVQNYISFSLLSTSTPKGLLHFPLLFSIYS